MWGFKLQDKLALTLKYYKGMIDKLVASDIDNLIEHPRISNFSSKYLQEHQQWHSKCDPFHS